jgi:hypothetical protein
MRGPFRSLCSLKRTKTEQRLIPYPVVISRLLANGLPEKIARKKRKEKGISRKRGKKGNSLKNAFKITFEFLLQQSSFSNPLSVILFQ